MATCSSCGKQMDDEARFCSQCGAALTRVEDGNGQRNLLAQAGLQPRGQDPAAEFVDPSKPIWVGWPARIRHMPGLVTGAVLLISALVWLIATNAEGPLGLIPPIVLAVVGVPLFLRATWKMLIEPMSLKYWLTVDRLFMRRGIIRHTTDQTELIRVDDIRVRQGLLERMLGVGNVDVYSTDSTDDALTIMGVVNPLAVAETIRAGMQRLRRQRGVFMEQI